MESYDNKQGGTESSNESSITDSLMGTSSSEPKLWAGKYKSVEDLEEAYKSSAKVFQENAQLRTQLEGFTKVPEDYQVPESITLRAGEIAEIKSLAKNSSLTQAQFLKIAEQMDSRVKHQMSSYEKSKQDLGEKTINILNDYVIKNYPEKLHETVLSKLIKDKDAMSDAMKHREGLLNSQVPGINKSVAGKRENYDGQNELLQLALKHQKTRNQHDKEKLIDVARQVAEARYR